MSKMNINETRKLMNTAKKLFEESDEEFAQKRFSDPQEKELWLKAASFNQYRSMNKWKSGTPYYIKTAYTKAWNELERYRKNKQHGEAGVPDVQKALQSLGIKKRIAKKTAIRGFNTYTPGYDLGVTHSGAVLVDIYGMKVDDVAEKIKNLGFDVINVSGNVHIPGGGSIGHFEVKKKTM